MDSTIFFAKLAILIFLSNSIIAACKAFSYAGKLADSRYEQKMFIQLLVAVLNFALAIQGVFAVLNF